MTSSRRIEVDTTSFWHQMPTGKVIVLIAKFEIKDVQTRKKQVLQLCTAPKVLLILVTVRLHTLMPELCPWLTNEKQRKTDIRLPDQ